MVNTSAATADNIRKRGKDESIDSWLQREISHFKKSRLSRLEQIKNHKITHDDFKYDLPAVTVHTSWYWVITFLFGVILLSTVGLSMWAVKDITLRGVALWPIVFVPTAIYIYLSIVQVEVDEIAGATFFGAPVAEFSNGPKLVWFGLFGFEKEPASIAQAEFPGDQDKIFRGDEKDPLPEGMVRPIRVLFAENPQGELPTDKQMGADVSGFVVARVVPERFFEFQKRVKPIDETQKAEVLQSMRINRDASPRMLEIMRYLVDIYARVMREIAGQMSYNQANEHMGLVNELLLIRLQYALIGMGVNISAVGTTSINAGHEFNKKIQERGEAKAERDTRITKAEALRVELEQQAKGDATAVRLGIEAQTRGLVKQAEALGVDGTAVLNAQIAQKLAESGATVVLGQTGLDNLVGLTLAKGQAPKPKGDVK